MTLNVNNISELPAAALEFVKAMGDDTIFLFDGEMGAGKTTFIAEVCRVLGVEDFANSPTFALINEYRSDKTAELIYHFDFYRVESAEEAMDMGVEDYFYSGALCLVEWPDKVADLIPEDAVRVKISVDEATGARTIEW